MPVTGSPPQARYIADDVMAQPICPESTEPERPIALYVDSPGGSLTAMSAVHATMQDIRPQGPADQIIPTRKAVS